jgi:drug/metabolite transporter (DMT)-like permease
MGGDVSRRGVVRCAVAAVLFGVSAPLASRLAGEMGAFTLAGLLYLGAALAVVPVVGRAIPSRAAMRRSGRRLAVAVVIGGAIGPVLFATGLADAPAATASLLLNLELVFTTIVAATFFGEHVDAKVVTGTTLVVVAGVLLGWSGSAELRWGAVLIATACLCWAVDNSVTAALDDLAPSHITLVKGVVAGAANLAIGLSIGPIPAASDVVGALAVGAFGYGVSITLWVAGARDLGAARAQLVFATAPFIGAAVAWTVLGDAATGWQVSSLVIALVGVTFVLGSDHEHVHVHGAVEHAHEHRHDDEHHWHTHDGGGVGRHSHRHEHATMSHRHGHVPDLHHRHEHDADDGPR